MYTDATEQRVWSIVILHFCNICRCMVSRLRLPTLGCHGHASLRVFGHGYTTSS